MKEYLIKVNTRMYDKKMTILSELNLKKSTPHRYIDKIITNVFDISPSHIAIPGNLYCNNDIDIDKTNYLLEELSKIAPIFYVRGEEPKIDGLIENDNINYIGDKDHCKNFYSDSINIFGMRLNSTYYEKTLEERKETLINYKMFLDELKKQNERETVNVLLCYDSLIWKLYDELDLSIYDLVITSNNYHNKEQTIQINNTLFFFADSINSKHFNLLNVLQDDINIDTLNIRYNTKNKVIARIRKRYQ